MDWTGEMTQSFYLASRTATLSTAGYGSPVFGAQQGPFACKQKDSTTFITDAGGTRIPVQHVLMTYQPVKPNDKVWPAGVDQTVDLNARYPHVVVSESLLGDDSQRLYQVGWDDPT